MLKQSASRVLASFRPSTYPRGYASGPSLAAALLDSLFEHPERVFSSRATRAGIFSRNLFDPPQETFTSIDFGFAFSDLGRCTFKTPSLYSALTLLPSASSGRVKLRIKLP
jgi:hypothetical protein